MPALLEEPVSTLAPAPPAAASFAVLVVAVIAMVVRYMSPLRLIGVLIAVIADAEETYIEAHGVGPLPAAETEALYILQLKVSAIVEETLNNSLSWRAIIGDFLRGRTFILLLCIQEVQTFETRIKMLKEYQLRTESSLNPRAIIFLRRRGQGPRYGGRQFRDLA
ncbi:hypothetical protein DFH08DRAFT_1075968 [Mycena albidolilacea]|uniref:Uncharacterized protein n=1 Tax=Mycena albidolilacea TaxID=1033008 RepID=A0AAD7AF81_9AGAR|nr:hypothetical protein DFH08DRAFT_1075968 [Mycena albidolilacea]